MKSFLLPFLLLYACLPLCAQGYTIENLPMPRTQGSTYVTNPDGVLSRAAVTAIDTTLYGLEKQTGIQVLVAAVKQIEGGDCFDFAYRLGRHAGIGEKGRDNGLVILLVTSERCIQFVTGYGLEGDLPDALCKQIQTRYMNPHLAKGHWDEGMTAGIQAVRQVLDGSMKRQPAYSEGSGNLLLLILVCCFVGVPALLWYNARQRTRCPRCHKHTLRPISTRIISQEGGVRTERTDYLCTRCGHTLYRDRSIRNDNDRHHPGGWGGPFIGGPFFGGFGGRGGGGGSGGGNFGGGDFGGGGAGSRF